MNGNPDVKTVYAVMSRSVITVKCYDGVADPIEKTIGITGMV